jgi:hypothetical protein
MENIKALRDFVSLINAILERPGMFLVNNVENLSLVILGYKMACKDTCVELLNNFLNDFKKYVNERSDFKEDIDWVRLIRFHGVGDKNTLDLFKRNFNDFLFINYPMLLESGNG